MPQPRLDPATGPLRAGRADGGKPRRDRRHLAALPGARAGPRPVHLHGHRPAGDGPDYFGHADAAADHHALGHGLSDREHARHPEGNFVRRAGTLVYRRHPQADDRRAAVLGRAHEFPHPAGHDRRAGRRGPAQIQR